MTHIHLFLLFAHPYFSLWRECLFGPIEMKGVWEFKLSSVVALRQTATKLNFIAGTNLRNTQPSIISFTFFFFLFFFYCGALTTLVNVMKYEYKYSSSIILMVNTNTSQYYLFMMTKYNYSSIFHCY